MQPSTLCKRCLLEDILEERSLCEIIRQRIALLPPDEKTGGAEYQRRLRLCRTCDQLVRGTCLQCGCYVEIRAAKCRLHCPHTVRRW